MSGWSPKKQLNSPLTILINQAAVPIQQSVTSLYHGGATEALVVGIFVSGIAGTVTVQLQHSFGLDVWSDVTGKVTGSLVNGWNFIKLFHNIAGDAALMPLYDVMRLTLTSNGTGAGQITAINVLQES